jgi:hypothetical protein
MFYNTADGFAEREAFKVMIKAAVQTAGNPDASITLGGNNGHDPNELIDVLLQIKVIPHEKN